MSRLFFVSGFGSWLPVSRAQKLQVKSASQGGQVALDMEAEDAALLEAATKQRSEDRDGGGLCVIIICKV
jgi:hypothetical protein